MTDRHDLRRQTRDIREALGRYDQEQLVDILTHVFRQYVVEGVPLGPPSAALSDELAGLSFAQLIERLQLRLDLPELQLFEVQNGRVSVRIDGRPMPIELPSQNRPEPLPMPRVSQVVITPMAQPAAPPPQPPPASPGVEIREQPMAAPPGVAPVGYAGAARPDARPEQRPAQPAARATSAPSSARATSARPQGPGPGQSPAAPAPAPAQPQQKPAEDDAKGGRFGLLEID